MWHILITKSLNLIMKDPSVSVGDPAVGKTAISQMFIKDGREFSKNYSLTFAAEVNTKLIPIPATNDAVELIIYDSPGLDLYIDLLDKFWGEGDLLMAVFDLTKKKSLHGVVDWHGVVSKAKWRGERAGPIASVLFGNKTDLDSRRACTDEEAIQLADSFDMKYFSGSVKNNQGLEDPIQFLAESYYKYCQKNNISTY